MAAVTVNGFALLIAAEYGVDTSNSTFIAQIERFINDGIKHILNYAEWPWRDSTEAVSLTVATGAGPYSLSTAACEIRKIRIAALDVELTRVWVEDLIAAGYDLEVSGQPYLFWTSGYDISTLKHQFSIFPVPNATYSSTVYTTLLPVDLGTSTAIPFPEDVRACLREIVRYYMEKQDKDYNAASLSKLDWDASLKRLKRKYCSGNEQLEYWTDVPGGRRRFPGFGPKYPI